MLLIPVMELKSGKSVHTEQNGENKEIISENPLQALAPWMEAGCTRLHIVDVDAVLSKQPVNTHIIRKIHDQYPDLEIQVGGISREEDIMIWLDVGAKYLVLNSKAIKRPHFVIDMCVEYAGSIMVALDSHVGKVRFNGDSAEHQLIELAREFDDEGVQGIILTDIPNQGHVNHDNINVCCELANQVEIPIIANGGVQQLGELESLKQAHDCRLNGIIVGRPLYNHKLDFKKAHDLIEQL